MKFLILHKILKKANPSVDFATGHAHIMMQTKNGPQYVPYYMTKNLKRRSNENTRHCCY